MAQTQIFSADSHTMEPANLWTQRMDKNGETEHHG
jgi:hypothetical protein